jgi:Sec-independent protein translocase protein TatA
VGLSTEILFILVLGLLILGPKQLHSLLGHVARIKAQVKEVSRGFQSQLAAELDAAPEEGETRASHESAGDLGPTTERDLRPVAQRLIGVTFSGSSVPAQKSPAPFKSSQH